MKKSINKILNAAFKHQIHEETFIKDVLAIRKTLTFQMLMDFLESHLRILEICET